MSTSAFQLRSKIRTATDHLVTGLAILATLLVIAPLAAIFAYLIYKGAASLNWDFFTKVPAPEGELGGGMANAIVGSGVLLGRRDHRSYVQPEEMVEYQSARYQAAEANILNETESYLNIDGYLYGVVSLKELPDATFPGMLQNFSTLGFPIVVSGQVVIPDQVKVLKSYKKRLQKMTAAQKDANGNFKSNPEAEVAQAQLMQVQRDIISSSLKTAKLSLSVVVRTSHPAVTMRDLEQSERELPTVRRKF